MEKTRSEKLIKSSLWGMLSYIVYTVVGFISRSIFLYKLGEDIVGLSALFVSIMNLRSITELGFANAIVIHLYKPVAENNYKEISGLINLYGIIYKTISVIVLIIGLCIAPFVHLMVTSTSYIPHLEFYFVLYVIQSAVGYLFNYKNALFAVYQESYIGDRIFYLFMSLISISQSIILYITSNYALYIVRMIAGVLTMNIVRTKIAEKRYPFLLKYEKEIVSKDKFKEIISYIKSITIDKSAQMIKTTTDTIFTSKFINVASTAIVDNYRLIIVAANAIVTIFFNNATASVGNMVITESKDTQFKTYLDLSFVSFWMYGFISTGIACVATTFIQDLWLKDSRFALNSITVMILAFNMFINGIEMPSENFLLALGLIKKARYRNALNVILNIIISLRLVYKLGISGVYLGTIISFAITTFWITPFTVLKHHFNGRYWGFIKLYAHGIITNILLLFICVFSCDYIGISGFLGLFLKIILCTAIYNTLFIISFFRNEQFRNMLNLVKNIVIRNIKFGR